MLAEYSATPTDYSTSLMASDSINFVQSNQNTENEVMLHLLRGDAALKAASNLNVNNSVYNNLTTNFSCDASVLTNNELNTIELLTKPGMHDGSFVLSVAHDTTDIPVNDVIPVNFGTSSCIQSKDYTIDTPTSSIYNSFLEISATTNNGPFYETNKDSETSRFSATFDDSVADVHHYQKALNSRINNNNNADPVTVTEFVTFNQSLALGLAQNSYFTYTGTEGLLAENTLNGLYQHQNNKIDIITDNLNNITATDCGTYRIQQFPDEPAVNINEYTSNTVFETENGSRGSVYPMHVGPTSAQDFNTGNLTHLPSSLDTTQFRSLFNLASDVIVPGYEFAAKISPNVNSGFNYSNGTKVNALATINDNDMYDNVDIMSNWISQPLTLTYNPATVSIVSTNANGSENLNNNSISLDTGRECLNLVDRNNSGELKLNTRTYSTRTATIEQNQLDNNLMTMVLYPNDNVQYLKTINNEIKTNKYVNVLSELVFKAPKYDSISFLTDQTNNAALNFVIDGNVLNNYLDTNDWYFNSSKPSSSNLYQVWSIETAVSLNGQNSFKRVSDDSVINNVYNTSYLKNLKSPVDQGSIDGMRIALHPKKVYELSFKNQLELNNWQVFNNSNNAHQALFTSNESAFIADDYSWPTLDEAIDIQRGGSVNFRFTFASGVGGNATNSNVFSDLNDRIIVEWGSNYQHSLPITELTQEVIELSTESSIISSTNYFVNNSYFESKPMILYYKTTVKTYNVTFNTKLRPFSNLLCKSPNYTVRTSYYVLQNSNTGDYYPVSNLKFLTGINECVGIDFRNIDEEIISLVPLTVTGSITQDDVKELNVTLQMNTALSGNQWFNVSEEKPLSIFYATVPVTLSLDSPYDNDLNNSDVEVWLEYIYMDANGLETSVILNDQDGYYIKLISASDAFATVKYWESNLGQLTANTDISYNENTITPNDGFSSIVNWSSNLYRVLISTENNDTTTVYTLLKNSDNSEEFVIKLHNNKIMAAPMFISKGEEDIWRVRTVIGNDNTAEPSEFFRSTIYNDIEFAMDGVSISNAHNAMANKLGLLNGVYLQSVNEIFNFNTVHTAGKIMNFDILSDQISVNLIGNASNTLLDIDSLSYNFYDEANEEYSKTLLLSYYRGYLGQPNITQLYNLVRAATTATWKWDDGAGHVYSQTVDVYRSTQVLNNFNYNGSTPSNFNKLNVKLEFNYSILADNDQRVYTLNSIGDNVLITIVNPNVAGFVPVTISKTLKDYLLYQFSGSNFNSTGLPLVLHSTRLKFNTNNIVDQNNFNKIWSLKLNSGLLKVYKSNIDVGNPASIPELDATVGPSLWGPVEVSGNYAESLTGLNVPGYVFKRVANVNYNESITFFVVARPMLKFTCYRNNYCPASLPYDANSVDFINGNSKVFYMSLSANGEYEPFASSINKPNINGTNQNYTNDLTKVNNILFNDHSNKLYSSYVNSPVNTPYPIFVRGSNLKIDLVVGVLKNQNVNLATTRITLYNDVADNLSYLSNSNYDPATYLKLEQVSTNVPGPYGLAHNVKLSFTQKSVTPYLLYNQSYSNIFFTVPSFFMNSANVVKLNLSVGEGTIINAYTRDIVKDSVSGDYKLVLYKYNAFSNRIDPTLTVVPIEFHSRYKKVLDIPSLTLQQTQIKKFGDLINEITKNSIVNTNWELDSGYNVIQWISFMALNIDCVQNIHPKIYTPYNLLGHAKFHIFTRSKLLVVKDKLDNIVAEINHDAIFKVPFVSTGGLMLQNMDNYTKIIQNNDVFDRTVYGFNRQLS